jgi:hypothetical protein
MLHVLFLHMYKLMHLAYSISTDMTKFMLFMLLSAQDATMLARVSAWWMLSYGSSRPHTMLLLSAQLASTASDEA